MFLRTFYSLVLVLFSAASLHAQDVVIYSKKSEEIAKKLQELVKALSEKEILKTYKLKSVTSETAASSDLTGKSFEVDESLKAKSEEIAEKLLAEFVTQAKALDNKELVAGIGSLEKSSIEKLEEELSKLKADGLKPLNEAVQRLTTELASNEDKHSKLEASEAADVDKIVANLIKALKEAVEDAVTSSNGKPEVEIKKAAEAMTHKQAEEKYPYPKKADVELAAAKKYPKYKVGDNVTVVFYPTPNRPQTKKGPIKSMSQDRIQISFTKILINDIKDPIMRDGMRPAVTDKNRKDYVDEIFADIRKKRNKYFNDNLQLNADAIIAENLKKGFILAKGKWQTPAAFTTTVLTKRLADWKKDKLTALSEAILADKGTKDAVEKDRNGYNAPADAVLSKFKDDIGDSSKQIVAEMKISSGNNSVTDDDIKKFEEARLAEEKRKKEEKEKLDAQKRKEQQAIKNKQKLLEETKTAPEESGSSQWVMIGGVLLIVGAIAFAFFNPKIRAKLIPGSGKKKSMQDVVSNLAPPGTPGADAPLPMPGGPTPPGAPAGGGIAPPPGVPAGMGAPQQDAMSAEKTKIDLDGDVSIVRRDGAEEAPQAAPRKKISLNLGSSATALSDDAAPAAPQAGTTQNSIDPGSIGGLTPLGGGLTPPGGGLTPPGGGLTPPGGGLTPPGGGLTPPGGGLTPPGGGLTPPGGGLKPPGGDQQAPGSDDSGGEAGNEDKSNLILNPNLDGSGSKLRLKK